MKIVTADKLPNMHSTEFRGPDGGVIPLVIQWPKGSTRVGENSKGEPFKIEMKADYGYIPATVDIDADDHLDVYVGTHKDSPFAYVLEQMQDGAFDEYKIMLGYDTLEEARDSYLEHLPEEMLGEIHEVPFDELFSAYKREEPKGLEEEPEVHEERALKQKQGDEKLSLIDAFVKLYKHEYEYFDKVADEVHDQLSEALNEAGIRAIVTFRAKRPRKLKLKLLKRNKTHSYQSFDDIYRDVVDMAGVRVALYLPADRPAVGQIIEQQFTLMRPPKNFPEDSVPGEPLGYVATHYLVRLKPEMLHKEEYQYADTNVEIQIASVLMHAWAEVTHDLIYKPEKGTLTTEEAAMISDLNNIVQEGEATLDRLQTSVQDRTHKDLRFELVAKLAQWLGLQSKGLATLRITAGVVGAVAKQAMEHKSVKYKGEVIRQNPLTGDWLVVLPDPYGSYVGSLSGMRGVVNRYHAHKKQTKKPVKKAMEDNLGAMTAYMQSLGWRPAKNSTWSEPTHPQEQVQVFPDGWMHHAWGQIRADGNGVDDLQEHLAKLGMGDYNPPHEHDNPHVSYLKARLALWKAHGKN